MHHDKHVTDATPEQVHAWLAAGEILLVDVREANEYAFERIHGALLYPFFLDGVAMNADLSLPDGLHPNAKGVAMIVERVMPKVEELIAVVKAKRLGAGKT